MKNILLIQTAFLGDVILATSLIEKLAEHYPNAKIDFLVRKGNEGLLQNNPHINETLVFDKGNKFSSLFNLIKQTRKKKYDLVVNAHRYATSGIIAVLSGGKQVIGFEKNPMSRFFTRKVPHQISAKGPEVHEIERNHRLISHITDNNPTKPRLYPSTEDEKLAPANQKYICLAPTSVWFTKQWPQEKWVELIKEIPHEYDIYLLGAPDDFDQCEQIKSKSGSKQVKNMCGKLSLLQSAAYMENAVMNYVNDSAPVHMATAVDAPVTAIFCSTVPNFGFTPLSTVSFTLEADGKLGCRPCGLHGHQQCPEGHFKCADIPVNKAMEKLKLKAS